MSLPITASRSLLVGIIVLLLFSLNGCGYRLIGASSEAPQYFTVAVPVFRNLTYIAAGEGDFTEAVVQALQRQGVQTRSVDAADYIVYGEIVVFTSTGSAFSATDMVQLYRTEVEIDITIRKRQNNTIVLRERLKRRAAQPAQTVRALQVSVDEAAKRELARLIAQDLLVRIIELRKNEPPQ
jgi:Lipopolysaccharide-assembly